MSCSRIHVAKIERRPSTEKKLFHAFVRSVAVALRGAWLAGSIASVPISDALAQAKQPTALSEPVLHKLPPVKQIVLTEIQIKGVIGAACRNTER